MKFLEWLICIGIMFPGWQLPLLFGVWFIYSERVFLGILVLLSAVPIEILLSKAYKKVKGENLIQQEIRTKEYKRQQEEREAYRKERIKTSPVKSLTPLEFEEFTALYLTAHGYKRVKRTPATGDFGADILAVTPDGKKICVQCKLYSSPIGIKAIQEIRSAKDYYKCDIACVAVNSNGYTKQAHKLALSTGVRLYEFNDLSHEFRCISK